eukprot:c32487_g1_i1.p1 GENE.c32487_g1_i1~~c32487_g1_i1.p1  ORF type:complete len:319 (+),score=61.35 c32487_g1_i1:108-1064(+)
MSDTNFQQAQVALFTFQVSPLPSEWYANIDFREILVDVATTLPNDTNLAITIALVDRMGRGLNAFLKGTQTFRVQAGRAKLGNFRILNLRGGDNIVGLCLRLHRIDCEFETLHTFFTTTLPVHCSHVRTSSRDFATLTPDSPISFCPHIGARYGVRLRAIGIHTIGDLGRLDVSDSLTLSHRLQSRGRPLKQALVAKIIDEARQVVASHRPIPSQSVMDEPQNPPEQQACVDLDQTIPRDFTIDWNTIPELDISSLEPADVEASPSEFSSLPNTPTNGTFESCVPDEFCLDSARSGEIFAWFKFGSEPLPPTDFDLAL